MHKDHSNIGNEIDNNHGSFVWIFYGKKLKNKINYFHEIKLILGYTDKKFLFKSH